MLPSLFARALAVVGKTVAAAAVNAAATELRRPETQQKLAEGADKAIAHGARALGRAVGNWRNRP